MTNSVFASDIDLFNQGLRPFEVWSARTTKVLDAWERRDVAAGFPTGLAALDNYIRLVPGELTILAARPGMGKTALALQIGTNIVKPENKATEKVAVFSAEMSGWSLYMRLACAVSGVPMFNLRSGKASADDYDLTRRAIRAIRDYPLLIDDRSRPDERYMIAELERMIEAYQIDALIFDFMELMGSDDNNEERRISNAAMTLKEIAKRFNMPVLAISHLNREVENRKDKIPQIGDLRYSGMIEQIADQILLMVRPKYYVDKGIAIDMKAYEAMQPGGTGSNVEDVAYIIIGKNRNGDSGIVRLGFNGPNMRFFDINRINLNEGLE